ncbi:MAG: hypothetical protein IPK25_07660 [Saprospiraceae bacterium]|nr:hypothetical protein [Saprospiraceae bacterium]
MPENVLNNHSYITPDGKILTGDWDKNAIYSCENKGCILLTEKNGNSVLGNLQLYYTSGSGDHYFSTSKKVYKWNMSDNSVRLLSGEQNERQTEFRNFTEDARGNIYVRERNKGIFYLKKGEARLEYFDCGIRDENFSVLYYDKATEKLWLASEKMVFISLIPHPEPIKIIRFPILPELKKDLFMIYQETIAAMCFY